MTPEPSITGGLERFRRSIVNATSFVLALLGFLSFVFAAFGGAVSHPFAKWDWVAIGLAFLSAAWVLNAVLVGGSHVTIGAS